MKITDIICEDATPGGTNDYQKMMAFVKANNIQGLPPGQQIALALFRELERQKQRNDDLDSELKAAEQRIDVAARSGEMQKQAIGQQQAELEKERGAIEKLDTATGERERASRQQLQSLAQRLEAVKNKPGVDPAMAERLENEIAELRKKGMAADRVADLERSISAIQQKTQVDKDTMNDLIDRINDAEVMGQEIEKTKTAARDQIEQLRKQLAHMQEIDKGLLSGDYEHDEAIGKLQLRIDALTAAVAGKKAAAQGDAAKMITPTAAPQPAANQQRYTPAQIATARKLGLSGDLEQPTPSFAVAESAFQRSIAWATGK